MEAAVDIEQHNAASIMLRNISLGLIISSISFLGFFLYFHFYFINFILAVISFILSIVAIRRSEIRRRWFYTGIFEAFVAHFLLDKKLVKMKQVINTPDMVVEEASTSLSKTIELEEGASGN